MRLLPTYCVRVSQVLSTNIQVAIDSVRLHDDSPINPEDAASADAFTRKSREDAVAYSRLHTMSSVRSATAAMTLDELM